MKKSARDRLIDAFAELEDIRSNVDKLQTASQDRYSSMNYAAGFLGEMLVDAVSNLPKAKREEFKQRLATKAAMLAQKI